MDWKKLSAINIKLFPTHGAVPAKLMGPMVGGRVHGLVPTTNQQVGGCCMLSWDGYIQVPVGMAPCGCGRRVSAGSGRARNSTRSSILCRSSNGCIFMVLGSKKDFSTDTEQGSGLIWTSPRMSKKQEDASINALLKINLLVGRTRLESVAKK